MNLHDEHHSSSFLVRIWPEARETGAAAAPLRVYVRDLRTGEEHYLADPEEVGRLLVRQARAEARAADDRERPAASGGDPTGS